MDKNFSNTHLINAEMFDYLLKMMNSNVEDFAIALAIVKHADIREVNTKYYIDRLAHILCFNSDTNRQARENMVEYQYQSELKLKKQ